MDVVCKDLGITYPEALKIRKPFLDWHFLNALERRKQEMEEKEEERKFWIALMNPEAYKELERKENTPLTEAETFEDVDESDLKKIAQLAKHRMMNAVRVDEGPLEEPKPEASAYINPVSWE